MSKEVSQEKESKNHKFYDIALEIINGKGGGWYVYSLQEDYIYSYENGYWKQIFDIELIDRLETSMEFLTKFPMPLKEQIVKQFKYKKYLRLDGFNSFPLINFMNYMYDPLGNNVLAHNPTHYSTIRIPYNYTKAATCELWLKTLNEILENDKDKIEILQEFIGYCLTADNEQKKALLLLGDTDTGKSTIIDIFRELIGDVNCSNVPLQYLSNPQYTPLLINKMVNIDPEVSKNAVEYEREFKLITGGKNEKVSCNQKHIPTFEFTPRCKLLLSANIFPKITDHSSAFYQRLIVIPCNRRFLEHEKNRNLHTLLREELPGIFNWACQGLWRFKERGRFKQYDFAVEAVEELEDENNPSNLFFKEHVEIVKGVEIEKGELYDKYKNWSEKNKQYPLSNSRFSMVLYKKYHTHTPKDTKNNVTNKRVWKNLQYVHFKNNNIKQEEINWQDVTAVAIIKTLSPTTIKADSQQDIIWG